MQNRRDVLKLFGAMPILFNKRLLGESDGRIEFQEKLDEPIQVKFDGYVRHTLYPVPLQRYLSSDAKKLYLTKINKTIHEYEELHPHGEVCRWCPAWDKSSECPHAGELIRQFAPVMFMCKVVPLVGGAVPVTYVKKWSAVLNRMAAEGIWKHGTLLRAYHLPLHAPTLTEANTPFGPQGPTMAAGNTPFGPRGFTTAPGSVRSNTQNFLKDMDENMRKTMSIQPTTGGLLTYVAINRKFADDWSGTWLNNHLGVEVFAPEGSITANDDWAGFPDLRA